jgi:hypothetical protein
MSAISRTSGVAGAGAPNRTYIAMRGYVSDFFSYTTSITNNYLTIGTLAPVEGATSGNCVKGAFLRETGKRIYPGANPGISTMMVGVFDYATGLKGFIDPNSFAFTLQNTDRPYYIDSAGYNPNSNVDPTLRPDQGPPVFTHGDMFADGNMYLGGNQSTMGAAFIQGNVSTMGNLAVGGNALVRGNMSTLGSSMITGNQSTMGALAVGGKASVAGPLVYTNVTTLTQNSSNTLTMNCALGNVWTITINADINFTLDASNVNAGQPVYVFFNNDNSGNYSPLITLGTNIRELYSSGPVSLQLYNGLSATMSFIGYGDNLLELSRMYINNA